MTDEICTDRLVMRRFTLGDVKAMHRVMSNREAMRFWSTPPHDNVEQTRAWVISTVNAAEDSDDFAVTVDGKLIGKMGCWRGSEMGFLFDVAVWSHGYASEAMAAFIDRRRALGSTELTADTDPRNLPSIRLLERHGFVETGRASGTWQVGHELCDSVYFRLEL